MLSRRAFCCGLPVAGFAATAIPTIARAEVEACEAFTTDLQKAQTPDDAIAMLKSGHERFLAGKPVNCDMMKLVHATEGGQAPFACVIGCIDSRVPPELVFDQQIGDIFTARVAGNFVNTDILGSMEFATKVAGAKAIVVLGHSSCGAIKGAIDDVKLGNLTAMLANLQPAVAAAPLEGEKSSKNADFVQKVADTNVMLTVEKLTKDSAVLKELVDAGALKIVGAMHDIHTGKVTFLG
ncbi:carbonic anhydrase family protein [Chthonobacter albigriseus]|uniref:carbonic anhydrase family protein n=1 Tax=Chthonobacter albigriseus TaxID=1683161 RepID=UPI0015EEF29D|nr:carbonic anhydrase family protein [Chthonobacter albigriseus]